MDTLPPGRSSRFQPGIMVNVEFGVSFSPTGDPHIAQFNYASRNMQDKIARRNRQQEDYYLQPRSHEPLRTNNTWATPHPVPLMPQYYHSQASTTSHPEWQRPQRAQRPSVRTREHERGSSAPPSLLMDRLGPISPVSPIGTIDNNYNNTVSPIQHTSSFPLSNPTSTTRTERPLPPLPSSFRLGDASLPWSTEPFYLPTSNSDTASTYESPTIVDLEERDSNPRGEDPQRARELETLQQAMMTVDSLAYDEGAQEMWSWESVGDIPRGPRSLGWAVSSADARRAEGLPSSPPPMPMPPPYVVSQYELWIERGRPMSSG